MYGKFAYLGAKFSWSLRAVKIKWNVMGESESKMDMYMYKPHGLNQDWMTGDHEKIPILGRLVLLTPKPLSNGEI